MATVVGLCRHYAVWHKEYIARHILYCDGNYFIRLRHCETASREKEMKNIIVALCFVLMAIVALPITFASIAITIAGDIMQKIDEWRGK